MASLYDRVLLEVDNDGLFQKKFDIIYNVIFASLWSMAYYNIILALTITSHTCKLPAKPENISEDLWRAFNVPRYGRKLTFVISLSLLVIGRFITTIAGSSLVFVRIGCIIAWFPSWSATQSATVISLEISSPKRRATVATLKLVSISIGMFLMPFFYWWLRDWRVFLIITTAPQFVFLLFSWNIIESPQWLWINGKSKSTVKSMKYIAKINRTSLSPDTENEILTTPSLKTNRTKELGPLALFSSWRITFTTILQLCFWYIFEVIISACFSDYVRPNAFANSLNYGVAILSSGENTNANPFLDFAWQALAEIPGYFIGAWLTNKIGRRYTGIVALSITSAIWVVHGFRETNYIGSLSNEVLNTVLVVTNRCSITVSYYVINLLNMEIYPTCIRQSGMSLGNLVSSGASAIAPYILHVGRRVDSRYPSVILTVTTLLGGILPCVFLPETLNKKLPETLEEAKTF